MTITRTSIRVPVPQTKVGQPLALQVPEARLYQPSDAWWVTRSNHGGPGTPPPSNAFLMGTARYDTDRDGTTDVEWRSSGVGVQTVSSNAGWTATDSDADGKIDIFTTAREQATDRNGDGKVDLLATFDAKGKIEAIQADGDFDGIFDTSTKVTP